MASSSRNLPTVEDRCKRSISNSHRCSFSRHGGSRYCLDHRLVNSRNPARSNPPPPPAASRSRVSDPQPGEIWAFPQGTDNFSRSYARIDRILVSNGELSVEATPLDAIPVGDDQMNLVDEGHLLAAGSFLLSKTGRIRKPISALSHRASVHEHSRGYMNLFYKIYPRMGEIWAVYESYNEGTKSFKYKLVEVVSGFTEQDGVDVFALERAGHGVYRRELFEGFYMIRKIPKGDFSMFSHLVPASVSVGSDEKQWKVALH